MGNSKYILIAGGVTSSLGKGIIAASLGKLLKARGYSVAIQKFDPYLNIDPGTLSPYEHGECFVTEDGAETDLDLGHYERFLDTPTFQANSMTGGKIYHNIISQERNGAYLGKTVQVVPHVTDEIKRNVLALGQTNQYDIVITEVGGCVGDIESFTFLEALRQLRWELGEGNSVVIFLTLLPYLRAAKELKTKPTQHAVKQLLVTGIQPDILVCRTERKITKAIREKLSLFCNVQSNSVIEAKDVPSIYDVPILMQQEKLDQRVLENLHLPMDTPPDMDAWRDFLHRMKTASNQTDIAIVGKYASLPDAYKSIHEALIHGGAATDCKVNVHYVESDKIEESSAEEFLAEMDGVIIGPGFGNRGIEGKLKAIHYVRTKKIPFFGICLGLQCAVMEFARNVLKLSGANSREFDTETPHPVIDLMATQKQVTKKGGTMRLGAYPCTLKPDSKAAKSYGELEISERHRHRYEFNNQYLSDFEKAGFHAMGVNPEANLIEVMELEGHPWYVGTQFHPEYKSTVLRPHPLFISFVNACVSHRK